jgi:dipeptidyl aminopeptidase/acylaminoacyl peptidase
MIPAGESGFVRSIATLAFALSSLACAAQEAYVRPGSNLVLEGIPRIAVTTANRVAAYSDFRGQRLLGWHPHKAEVLVAQRGDQSSQVFRLSGPGATPEALTAFAEPVARASYPPSSADYLVISQDEGGNERFRLYHFDPQSKRRAPLSDAAMRTTSAAWSKRTTASDSRDLLYYAAVPTGQRVESSTLSTELRRVDPTQPGSDRLIARLPGVGWSIHDISDDRRSLIVGEYRSATESYLWLLDAESATKKLLTPRRDADPGSYFSGSFVPDSKRILALTTRGSEFARLVEIDPDTRAESTLVSHDWSIDGFTLSDNGRWLAYRTNEDGTSALRILDRRSGETRVPPPLPHGVIGAFVWRNDDRTLAFNLSGARDPLAIFAYDVEQGTLTRWSPPVQASVDPQTFVDPALVRWTSFDGRRISGYLYLPPERFAGKRPLKIVIHGGPESQFRPGFLGRYNYLLNEMGVALLFPNVRGSSGYGRTFLSLDDGRKREDAVRDIVAALDWVAQQPRLDAERVLVSGASYGGYMSLAVATLYPERVACTITEVGITNFVSFLQNTESYRRDLRRSEYGDERDPEMRAFLESISPLGRAHRIKRPLLVVHGANDPRVPVSEAEAIAAAVRKNGTSVWSVIARDEGHGFAKRENADFRFVAAATFAESCLGPGPVTQP